MLACFHFGARKWLYQGPRREIPNWRRFEVMQSRSLRRKGREWLSHRNGFDFANVSRVTARKPMRKRRSPKAKRDRTRAWCFSGSSLRLRICCTRATGLNAAVRDGVGWSSASANSEDRSLRVSL